MNTELKTLQDFIDTQIDEGKTYSDLDVAPLMRRAAEAYGKYCYEQGLKADRWISVKDSLPENDVDVLITNQEDRWVSQGFYWDMEKEWRNSPDETGVEVFPTHWMPFPLPPLPGTQTEKTNNNT